MNRMTWMLAAAVAIGGGTAAVVHAGPPVMNNYQGFLKIKGVFKPQNDKAQKILYEQDSRQCDTTTTSFLLALGDPVLEGSFVGNKIAGPTDEGDSVEEEVQKLIDINGSRSATVISSKMKGRARFKKAGSRVVLKYIVKFTGENAAVGINPGRSGKFKVKFSGLVLG